MQGTSSRAQAMITIPRLRVYIRFYSFSFKLHIRLRHVGIATCRQGQENSDVKRPSAI